MLSYNNTYIYVSLSLKFHDNIFRKKIMQFDSNCSKSHYLSIERRSFFEQKKYLQPYVSILHVTFVFKNTPVFQTLLIFIHVLCLFRAMLYFFSIYTIFISFFSCSLLMESEAKREKVKKKGLTKYIHVDTLISKEKKKDIPL